MGELVSRSIIPSNLNWFQIQFRLPVEFCFLDFCFLTQLTQSSVGALLLSVLEQIQK